MSLIQFDSLARICSNRAGAVALALGAWLLPARAADACSYALVAIEASYPTSGALDVPTNAVLFAAGSNLDGGALVLERDDGAQVEFELIAVESGGFDLKPLTELEANRGYVLTSAGTDPAPFDRIEFTTGAGPASVPDVLPLPDLEVAQVSHTLGSCGKLSSYCVDARVPEGTRLEARLGGEVLQEDGSTAALSTYFSRSLAEDECLVARLRDVRGNRSAPATLCRADIPLVDMGEWSAWSCPSEPVASRLADVGHEPSGADTSGPIARDTPTATPLPSTALAEGGGCALGGTPAPSPLGALGFGLTFAGVLIRRLCRRACRAGCPRRARDR